MKPCGFIATYMFRDLNTWRGWKELPFNIALFIYQLTFMVWGTIIGKIKWPKASLEIRVVFAIGAIGGMVGGISLLIAGWDWWLLPLVGFIVSIINIGNYRNIPWRQVWKAAQVSHVRLCLQGVYPDKEVSWQYINFGLDKAKTEIWRMSMIDGKRFKYYFPTFEPSDEFIERMIDYANKLVRNPVAREYDWLQLIFGYIANLIIWIPCPWLWGKEVVPWFNLPGGLEVCISGFVAVLRWAENVPRRTLTMFFKIYHIPVIPPCLVPLSKNWREHESHPNH